MCQMRFLKYHGCTHLRDMIIRPCDTNRLRLGCPVPKVYHDERSAQEPRCPTCRRLDSLSASHSSAVASLLQWSDFCALAEQHRDEKGVEQARENLRYWGAEAERKQREYERGVCESDEELERLRTVYACWRSHLGLGGEGMAEGVVKGHFPELAGEHGHGLGQ